MSLKIRNAIPSESDILSDLSIRSKGHWGYSDTFLNSCRAELNITGEDIACDHFHYYVAELDHRIIGFYALDETEAPEFELDALFVEPAYIGGGFGRALIEHAKSTASSMGATDLTIQGDPNAESFYLAAGAHKTGTKESASITGRLLPIFNLKLLE